jgi:ornithine cyclodeaminase/alanine dehydrogenase-like protein (mu-crystallin family)
VNGNSDAVIDTAPRVYTAADVRAAVTMQAAIDSARRAFVTAARGTAVTPDQLSLDVDDHKGEVHVKGAYLQGSGVFALKTSTGFGGNAALGLPSSDGFTSVFEARTGRLLAILLDKGYLTNLRTAAAGAVVLEALAPPTVHTVAVVGTGDQSGFQIEGLCAACQPDQILVVGRERVRAEQVVARVKAVTNAELRPTTDLESAVRAAQVVITATSARHPLVQANWLRPSMHITAVGSDSAGKRELELSVLRAADQVVVDDVVQSRQLGELKGVPDRLLRRPAVALGDVLSGDAAGRRNAEDLTLCDLSGLGVQDAAIAETAVVALDLS